MLNVTSDIQEHFSALPDSNFALTSICGMTCIYLYIYMFTSTVYLKDPAGVMSCSSCGLFIKLNPKTLANTLAVSYSINTFSMF